MRLLTVCMTILTCQAAFAAAPTKLAVLGGEEPGWNDLLVARLSEAKEIAIVERQQLKAILNEQAIMALLGNRADRGRIGGIAGADLLVLLTGDKNELRLVVCDTQLGVTLQDLSLPLKDETHDKVVAALADQTLRVVDEVRGGIKQVVAVPDFVSRDLTFERSFLQFDYAEVLRAAYRRIPGLAVISVDEATAIASERDLAEVEQKLRPVPVFIEGEYRTERDPKTGVVTVQITLRARAADKTLHERKLPAMPLEQAGGKLLAVFAQDLVRLNQVEDSAIDAAGQFRLLIERADAFSALGEFQRSTALREAALLLKPDADEQRTRLIREYTRRNRDPIQFGDWPKGSRQSADDPVWMSIVTSVVDDWKRSLHHCEHLVRNRRLCREEATDLTYNAVHSICGVRRVDCALLKECEAIKKDFLRHVFACIAYLESAAEVGRRDLTGSLDVYHSLFKCALLRCDLGSYDADDLDLIADLLVNRLPPTMWPSYQLNFFLRESRHKSFTSEQYLAFLDRLLASDRPLVRVYGRYGKFCYRRYDQRESSPELLQEAKAIVAEAEKLGFNPREYDYFMTQLRDPAVLLARELASRPAVEKPAKAGEQTARPPASFPATSQARRPRVGSPAPANSRISLEPIELTFTGTAHAGEKLSPQMRWPSGGGWGGVSNFHPLGSKLDAITASGAVLFLSQPGKVAQVLADPQLHVNEVIDDGRYVWVASDYERGLTVLNRDGKELLRVDKKQGLPPCDQYGMVAHPLGPGRLLAAGSFGNEHRAWIALVEFDGAAAQVEVIHEATKVWDHQDRNQHHNLDPTMTFVPEAMFEHVLPGPNPRRIIFILRRYNPLLVDPESKKVTVYPVTDWYRQCFPRLAPPSDAFLSIDGCLWIAGSAGDCRSYRLDEATGLFLVVRERPNWHMGGARSGSLARDGEWLYYAGNQWRRIHLPTGKEELLVDNLRELPNFGQGGDWRLAKSSHYGLVAFHSGTLYRVRIKEAQAKP